MRRHLFSALFALLPTTWAAAESSYTFALGGAAGWRVRQDYGSRTLHQFVPEALLLGYVPLADPFWLRPELRLGFATQQPDMPRSLRIEERDTTLTLGAGLLFNWHVVPAISLGYTHILRKTKVQAASGIDTSRSRIPGSESLAAFSIQAGVGLPAAEGFVVLEPWIRYTGSPEDARLGAGYGVDLSFGIF